LGALQQFSTTSQSVCINAISCHNFSSMPAHMAHACRTLFSKQLQNNVANFKAAACQET